MPHLGFLSHPCCSRKAIYLYKWFWVFGCGCFLGREDFVVVVVVTHLYSAILKLQIDDLFFPFIFYVGGGGGC